MRNHSADPNRLRHAALTSAVLVTGVLLLGACSLIGSSDPWPRGSGAPPAPNTATTAIALAKAGTPRPAERDLAGPEGCRQLASGPFARVAHGPDPRGALRDGEVLGLAQTSAPISGTPALNDDPPGGLPGAKPDQVSDYDTLDRYRDPNTMASAGSLHAAWSKLHFEGATAASWRSGHDHQTVTITQFGSAAEAQQALVAHLTELCPYANATMVRPDHTGVTLGKDTGSTRSLFVLDDVEVSVYACPCSSLGIGATDEWAKQVEATLRKGARSSSTA